MADVVPTSTAETIVVVTSNDQEVFSFDFLIYSTDQIRVILRPNSGAPERELVYPYDFSVSGLDQNNGGYITTIGVSVSVNDEIYMWRDTEIDREKDWAENGDYKASLVNREQNEIYMILQELARDLRSGSGSTTRRGAMFPMGYAGSNILPTPEGGKLLSWADDMSAIINRDIPGWISGSGRPLQSVGRVGDFYLDIITADVYGAKTASGWGGVVANIRGTRGAQGIQGIQGVRGVQGVPGIQGVQGIQGQQGAQGTKGDTGEKGEKGEKGDKGDPGLRGIQGVQGAAGEKGDSFKPDAMGLAIERSLYDDELRHFSFLDTEHGFLYFKRSDASGDWTNGTAFTTGAQGAPGVTGEQGVQGERGEKGDKGDKGEKGEKGDAGEKGEQGIQGIQGVQGIQGIQGEQGEKGEKGDSANFFDTKSSVQITSIPIDVSYINIIGSGNIGDGLGGLYIDSDTGSNDTVQSSDGRTWYRAPDSFNKFGLGVLSTQSLASGVDLNDARPAGLYRVPNNALNRPLTGSQTFLIQELPFNLITGSQRRQLAFQNSTDDIYTRSQNSSGVNTPWRRLLNDVDLENIADRAFANVLDYGTPTDGVSDCSVGFSAALAGGNKTVYVPAGVYYFNKYVRIQKNTHLIFDPGAIINVDATSFLVNGIVGDANYATGYNGDSNIHIEGGQFNILRTSGAQTAFIQIAHARNILVENCDFKSLWRGHFIEYNAVDDGVIRNCRFTGQQIQAGDSGRAAINLDFSYEVGFPTFGAWDGTKCSNITVEGNFFDGCQTCVDSHGATQPSGRQYGFIIINNVMRNSGQHAIWARWWGEFMISGNEILSSVDKGILMQDCFEGMIGGNFIKNVATNGDHAVQLQQCQAVIVTPNQIRPGTAKYAYAYRCFGGSGNRIDASGATAGASGVHSVTDGSVVGVPTLS